MKTSATFGTSKVFSFTAPFVTEEAERKARESLSESELLQIHNDLYGIRNEFVTTSTATNDDSSRPSTRTSSLECTGYDEIEDEPDSIGIHRRISNSLDSSAEQLRSDLDGHVNQSFQRKLGHEMIRESIEQLPNELNDAYIVAIGKNPSLLSSNECDWDYFLYKYNSDVWAAADAIAYYWSLRRTIFGSERYYKFMTLDEDGCMYDVRNEFAIGGLRIDGHDDHGRPILYLDIDSGSAMHRDITVQIAFFWEHHLIYSPNQIPYIAAANNNLVTVDAASSAGSSSAAGDSVSKHDSCSGEDVVAKVSPETVDDLSYNLDYRYIVVCNLRGYELSKHFDRKRSRKLFQVLHLLPYSAFHVCVGSRSRSVFGLVLPFYKALFPERDRVRVYLSLVIHYGSNTETIHSLQKYGISKSSLDVKIGGTLNTHDFQQRLALHQQQREVDQQHEEHEPG